MSLGFDIGGAILVALAVAATTLFFARKRERKSQEPARAITGEAQFTRPDPGTVEGLEIRYGSDALVRSVRVGAMNCEHKELLLTMDAVQWNSLQNAQKQEVLAAARSTWASKMCAAGPDIAYVVVKTDQGRIVGRADPHSVTVL